MLAVLPDFFANGIRLWLRQLQCQLWQVALSNLMKDYNTRLTHQQIGFQPQEQEDWHWYLVSVRSPWMNG
jgi:hypothetical protein